MAYKSSAVDLNNNNLPKNTTLSPARPFWRKISYMIPLVDMEFDIDNNIIYEGQMPNAREKNYLYITAGACAIHWAAGWMQKRSLERIHGVQVILAVSAFAYPFTALGLTADFEGK